LQWLRQAGRESERTRRNTACAPQQEAPAIGTRHATNIVHWRTPAVSSMPLCSFDKDGPAARLMLVMLDVHCKAAAEA
jgi:hypothetical protein